MAENCDADGYLCEFEDDIPEVERKFYLKVYPKIDLVVERRVHCTSCGNHIGTAPISEAIVRMHPVLKVTQCRKCHTFYNSGEFEKGEDGSELYCRWCGQGGEVYCCAKCPYVFCKGCIVQNLSRGCVNDIAKNETWNCFSCAPKIMWHLRAQHWALVNFMEKQKKKLLDKNLTEDELNEEMSKDLSSCCKNKLKKATPPQAVVQRKPNSILKLPQVQPKKPSLFDKSVKMATNMAKKTVKPTGSGSGDNEVVCTPDIMSMFDEPQATVIPKPTSLLRPVMTQRPAAPAVRQPPPLLMRQFPNTPSLAATQRSIQQQIAQQQAQQSIQLTLPAGFGTGPNAMPVYHTINGYRIDLNTAAQQETFRLPNGKLIQVKKQIPVGQMPPNPTPPQPQPRATYPPMTGIRPRAMPMNQMRPTTVAGNNSTYVSVRYNNANQANPGTRLLNGGPMYQNQPNAFQAHYNHQQQQQNMIHQQQQQQQHQQQQLHQPQQQQQPTSTTTNATHPPQIVFQRVQHPPTKLGKTRTHFEDKVFGGLEVCHQIIAKINTLTNSSSYKNVRNFRDLKELNIHLSYLFQYAMGRFKGLQEKVVEDIKSVEAVITETEANDKQGDSDGDDLEIMEPETTLIELDSDDDTAHVTTSGGPKKPVAVPALAQIRPPVKVLPTVCLPSTATIRLVTRPKSPVVEKAPSMPSLDDAKLKQAVKVTLLRAECRYPHLKAKLEAFKARRMAERQLNDIAPVRKQRIDISDDEDIPLSDKISQSATTVMRRKRKASDESSDSDWEKEARKKKKRVKFSDDRSNQSSHSRASSTHGSVKGSMENLSLASSSRPFRRIGETDKSDKTADKNKDEVEILEVEVPAKTTDEVEILEADLEKIESEKTDEVEILDADVDKVESEKADEVEILGADVETVESEKTDEVEILDSSGDKEESKTEDTVEILDDPPKTGEKPTVDDKKEDADTEMVELIDVSDKDADVPLDKSQEPHTEKTEEKSDEPEKDDTEEKVLEPMDVDDEVAEKVVEPTTESEKSKDELNSSIEVKSDAEVDPLNASLANVLDTSDDLLNISVTEILELDSSPEKKANPSNDDNDKSEAENEPDVAQPAKAKSPEPGPAQLEKEVPVERPVVPQVVNPIDVSHELSPPPSPMSPPPSPPNEVPIVNGVVAPAEVAAEEKPAENGTANGEKPADEPKEKAPVKDVLVEEKSGEPTATTSQDQQLGLEDLIEHGLTSEDYGVAPEDWNSLMM